MSLHETGSAYLQGRYLLSRDYMTMKLWDLNMEKKPVAVYNVHEPLRGKLCDLYESDCIFDKFDCCMNRSCNMIATGTYNNSFKVFSNPSGAEACLDASRDPLKKRVQSPPKVRTALQIFSFLPTQTHRSLSHRVYMTGV